MHIPIGNHTVHLFVERIVFPPNISSFYDDYRIESILSIGGMGLNLESGSMHLPLVIGHRVVKL